MARNPTFINFFLSPSLPSLLLFSLLITTNTITTSALDHAVLSVKYKYAGQQRSLAVLKAHDSHRQLRFLSGVDLPLGGSGRPNTVGSLFYFLQSTFID